mmetsp:Transcript_87528/g.152375  ORF Transcript_87528/g.152375 Transcript_87528/m.152375 type:complete len:510 (-) Transcript_87528:71-1600(-)
MPNPERLNLDRKRLGSCPLLEGEERLKLLNYQNNLITEIANLHNLPNLVFLDLYNNNITHISNLGCVPTLRVLMLGKNNIEKIEHLDDLPRLDVLDLHNNAIRTVENLSHLTDLRVLNLAGNRLKEVSNIRNLTALTELNARRNSIETLNDLDTLPHLHRVFLSSNKLETFQSIECCLDCKSLTELSLDGNSVFQESQYRWVMVDRIKTLKQLDTRRVTDEERKQAPGMIKREEDKRKEAQKLMAAQEERNDALSFFNATWNMDAGSCYTDPSLKTNPKRKGFVELQDTQGAYVLHVYGDGAEPQWEPDKAAGIRHVVFEYISIERVCTVFIPTLKQLPNLHSVALAFNNCSDLNQLAGLGELPHVEQLTINDNRVLRLTKLLKPFCIMILPQLKKLNDVTLDVEDRSSAEQKFGPFARLLSSSLSPCGGPSHRSLAQNLCIRPLHVNESRSKAARQYVDGILHHTKTIDAKIQCLAQSWNDLVDDLIVETLVELQTDQLAHKDFYALE